MNGGNDYERRKVPYLSTCTEDGNIEYWTCSVCNKYFSDETGTNEIEKDSWVIKAAHNHNIYRECENSGR